LLLLGLLVAILENFQNEDGSVRDYDVIYFRNGYAKDCLKMKVEFLGVEVGEVDGREVDVIGLGDVVWSGGLRGEIFSREFTRMRANWGWEFLGWVNCYAKVRKVTQRFAKRGSFVRVVNLGWDSWMEDSWIFGVGEG